MKDLVSITLSRTKIRFVPDCREFIELWQLSLDDYEALESLGNMGIHPHIQEISAVNNRGLKASPQIQLRISLTLLAVYQRDKCGGNIQCIELLTPPGLICGEARAYHITGNSYRFPVLKFHVSLTFPGVP